jgi:hypothetical protein
MDTSFDDQAFIGSVARLVATHTERWFHISEEPPEFLVRYSLRQKLEHQKEFDLMLNRTPGSLDSYMEMDPAARRNARTRVRTLVLRSLLREEDPRIRTFANDCERNTESFIGAAREFDPSLSEGDIHQALRNMWVFNSIQLYLQCPVSLTPSSFAYSLIYPYSDNCLDAAGINGLDVAEFLFWLSQRLHGVAGATSDGTARKLSRLIHMIEDEYPRLDYPDVHQSLSAIHAAQMRSLHLRRNGTGADERVLMPVTIEKGGTSVLADGFLAAGNLNAEEADMIFAYGVLLQLIDDLQDMEEDRRLGYSSPFTRALEAGVLEETTNRLIYSVRISVTLMAERSPAWGGPVSRLIMRACNFLIFEAVARYRDLYSDSYLTMIEENMPLPLAYLGELRSRAMGQAAVASENGGMIF